MKLSRILLPLALAFMARPVSAQIISGGPGVVPTILTDKIITTKPITHTTDTSITPDLSQAQAYAETALATAITINAPTNVTHWPQYLKFFFTDNGTGRAITWNAAFINSPTATTTASTDLEILFELQPDGTHWKNLADTGQAVGSGTVTTSGSPTSGKLAKFSSATAITNADLSGDCTTSGTLVITCATTGGVANATTTGTQTLTNKRITKRSTSGASTCDVGSGATITPVGDSCDVYAVTAAAVAITTVNAPSGTPTNGQTLTLTFVDNSTNRAISGWNAIYVAGSTTLPTTTTTGKTLICLFYYNAPTSKWLLMTSDTF